METESVLAGRRILLLCRHFGGFGGEENYVRCLLDAFPDVTTDVFVTQTLSDRGLLAASRPNLTVHRYSPYHLLRHLWNHRTQTAVFIAMAADRYEGRRWVHLALRGCRFLKAVVPAGNNVSKVACNYDRLFWEADNAADYGFGGDPRNVVMYPPALHPNSFLRPIPEVDVRGDYYLTVFNDYDSELKGGRVLRQIAGQIGRRIFWCTNGPVPDQLHENVRVFQGSRDMVALLLASCRAYVCFSSREGFGWSLFEAMAISKPLVTRPVGIAHDYRDRIFQWNTPEELVSVLNETEFPTTVNYDLRPFEPKAYRTRLEQLIAEHESSTRRIALKEPQGP